MTSELRTVAALYVEPDGVYRDVPGVDPWDEARDARHYAGPHPVMVDGRHVVTVWPGAVVECRDPDTIAELVRCIHPSSLRPVR